MCQNYKKKFSFALRVLQRLIITIKYLIFVHFNYVMNKNVRYEIILIFYIVLFRRRMVGPGKRRGFRSGTCPPGGRRRRSCGGRIPANPSTPTRHSLRNRRQVNPSTGIHHSLRIRRQVNPCTLTHNSLRNHRQYTGLPIYTDQLLFEKS